jgi:ligand-binding sensor domain-containing protein
MTRLSLSNRHALVLAGLLGIAIPVGAQPAKTKAVEPPANRDPYFTPTAAKSTSTMPRVIIRTIRQDRAGNIWFATFGGPICYDGKTFTNFSEEVGLAKTRIFSLLEARSGALWFGSITGGASRFDGKSFTKFTAKEGLANNDVVWIFEDRDANIWFATGAGVSRYDGNAITTFTTKDGLVHNSVHTIAQDATGRIWFGTQGGICSYDGKSFANLADQVGRPFVNIRSMVVDQAGNLWFGGQEGAFRYDGKTVAMFTSKDGLLDDFVGSILVDRAGNLWFGHPGRFPDGSGGGASRYDGKTFKHFTQKDGLGSATVYCMLEDKAGNIWFGSADAGACRYDGKAFTNFSAAQPTPLPARRAPQSANDQRQTVAKGDAVSELSKSIWSVFQDKNDNYWFGSNGQGVYRYDGKALTQFTTKHGLLHDQIRGIQGDKSGNVYINTLGGVSKFNGRTFTTLKAPANPSPMTEWKLQPDDLWFAGAQNSGVVFRFDGQTLHRLAFPTTKRGDDHYARIPRSKYPNAKYNPYDVYTIYRDGRGRLWFGTADLGACRYDGKSFDWLYEDHLTNVPNGGSFGIRSIVEDKEGKFWICNTRYRYDVSPSNPAGNGLVQYKQEKGIGGLEPLIGADDFYFAAAAQDNQRDLWMTTYRTGAWRYDGKRITRYPVKDGSKVVLIVAIYKDKQGGLWLGTNDSGAFRFDGKSFEKFHPVGAMGVRRSD